MLSKTVKSIGLCTLLSVSTATAVHGKQADVNGDHVKDYRSTTIDYNNDIDVKINELADSLLASSRINKEQIENIAITAFVNLHNLDETSYFGRTLSEAFFNELFVRGFDVIDFRGKGTLSINNTGEFFITRNIRKISKQIKNKYVLVGTYSVIEKSILINVRIMDNMTGELAATAKTYLTTNDCRLLDNCPKPRVISITSERPMTDYGKKRKQKMPKSSSNRTISITK
jgi:TolB-like protein